MKQPRGLLFRRFGGHGLKTYVLRVVVQGGFAILLLWLGVLFARFVGAIAAGESPLPERPPGAEGFLPISGFMGALDWLHQGELNDVHPAATVLFLLFTLIALLLRKAFCAWICPVGLLSESLARLGRRLFGRNFRPWAWVDVPLRSIKYLALGFFVWVIGTMSAEALQSFIRDDYNKVSDVKMYFFFADLSVTAGVVLALLAVGSLFVNGFWCRYLCPYGAWLGLFSWLSPVKIRREAEACTDCGQCSDVCMARLPVSSKMRITSVECTGCLDCLASCPVPDSLTVGTPRRRWDVRGFAAAVVLLFAACYVLARATGVWESGVDEREYFRLYPILDQLDHTKR